MNRLQDNFKQTKVPKNWWLWGLLLATLAASAWVPEDEENTTNISKNIAQRAHVRRNLSTDSNGSATLSENSTRLFELGIRRKVIESEPVNLFLNSSEDNFVNTDTKVTTTPETPALPFNYAGNLIESGNRTIFLLSGERSYAVRLGDSIDDVWKILTYQPTSIVFSYLPLKTKVVMNIGDSN